MFLADDNRLDTLHKKYLPRKGFSGTFLLFFLDFYGIYADLCKHLLLKKVNFNSLHSKQLSNPGLQQKTTCIRYIEIYVDICRIPRPNAISKIVGNIKDPSVFLTKFNSSGHQQQLLEMALSCLARRTPTHIFIHHFYSPVFCYFDIISIKV